MRKDESTDANITIKQMLELSDKAFKTAIVMMFQQAITNTLETNVKMENLNKEMENVIKN